jgi:hypothetical protein
MISEALAPVVAEGKLLAEDVMRMQPLDALLLVMRKRLIAEDWAGVVIAAQSAAPYVHTRMTVVDTTIRHTTEPSDAELEQELASLRAKVQQARSPPLIEGKAEASDDQHAALRQPTAEMPHRQSADNPAPVAAETAQDAV